jgi:phosphoglycerate dehydrogenase-like enzyme
MTVKMVFLPPQRDETRAWARAVAEHVPQIEVAVAETPEDARREIVGADAAFGTLPRDLLERAARLRWLQAPAAAPPAGYYYPELAEHPVQVTNFRGIFNEHIAAHIMAFVLAFARGLQVYIPRQLRHEWKPAPLCAAFGMRVIGVDARRSDQPEGVAEMHTPEHLDELLPRADFVVLTVPHTPETEGFMNAERFGRMKRTAFFINIGRGMTTRLDDLVEALRAGRIAGAALDVFEQEPLPADHPLWDAPNVLLTPHVAGYGPYLDDRRREIVVDNARRFVAGEPLRNVVDKAHWF